MNIMVIFLIFLSLILVLVIIHLYITFTDMLYEKDVDFHFKIREDRNKNKTLLDEKIEEERKRLDELVQTMNTYIGDEDKGYVVRVVNYDSEYEYGVGVLIVDDIYYLIIPNAVNEEQQQIDITEYVDNGNCIVILYKGVVTVNDNKVFNFVPM